MPDNKKFKVPEKVAPTGPVADDMEAYATALQAQAELQDDIAESLDGINASLYVIAKCMRRQAEQVGALTPEDIDEFSKLEVKEEEEDERASD